MSVNLAGVKPNPICSECEYRPAAYRLGVTERFNGLPECNKYGNIPEDVKESNKCEGFKSARKSWWETSTPGVIQSTSSSFEPLSSFNSETWTLSTKPVSSYFNQTEGLIKTLGEHVQNDPDLTKRVEELSEAFENHKDSSLKSTTELEDEITHIRELIEAKVGKEKVKEITLSYIVESYQEIEKENPSLWKMMSLTNDVEDLKGIYRVIQDTLTDIKVNQNNLKEEVTDLKEKVDDFKSWEKTLSFIKWGVGVGFSGSFIIIISFIVITIVIPFLLSLLSHFFYKFAI